MLKCTLRNIVSFLLVVMSILFFKGVCNAEQSKSQINKNVTFSSVYDVSKEILAMYWGIRDVKGYREESADKVIIYVIDKKGDGTTMTAINMNTGSMKKWFLVDETFNGLKFINIHNYIEEKKRESSSRKEEAAPPPPAPAE